MTVTVNIHNSPSPYKVQLIRRFPATGLEENLSIIEPGMMAHNQAFWQDCELVLREVPPEPATPA